MANLRPLRKIVLEAAVPGIASNRLWRTYSTAQPITAEPIHEAAATWALPEFSTPTRDLLELDLSQAGSFHSFP